MPAPSKRDKQSVKRGAHNKGVRTRLRNLSKSFYRAVESGGRRGGPPHQGLVPEASKAAGKGIIHPNRAAVRSAASTRHSRPTGASKLHPEAG